MATWVKICGITRVQDARAAFDAGADAIGINFWPSSKRYCEPSRARDMVAALAPGAVVFGVFVRMPREDIAALVREVGLGGVQLHGDEPISEAEGWDVPVIRAVAARSREAVVSALEIQDRYSFSIGASGSRRSLARDSGERGGPDAPRRVAPSPLGRLPCRVLVDNAAGGGSGVTVDAQLLDGIDLGEAILAGGLTPQNVAASVARFRPFGVDTAGGVETAPGVKDARKIEAFVAAARSTR